ncbi:signal peptidase I [Candidatus Protochlamydia phocaeensis]|uniref:signal peptidase I n=1 Tax=Candidatus Protochlamydia phocaeensis TaxID=1414722 RepID=UPI000A63F593|nr:signal peptidase I [Candidatus Protochlamydia phocaeensis]
MPNDSTSLYSLHKSRQIMKSSYKWYRKKAQDLPSDQRFFLESRLEALDQALLKDDRSESDRLARELEAFCQANFRKSFLEYLWEIGLAIIVALLIATVVRQMWFELYEIPTGSMRPTFEEQDHLTVTKTAFGINVPLQTAHFYFDPNLVQRTSVIIWSGDGIPHLDSDSTFMGIFPYTKRYIKSCMGKPGDVLYFYGGKIYAIDKDGNDLTELRDSPYLSKLEHIPFTHFEGRRSYVQDPQSKWITQAVFNQFNKSIGRLRFMPAALKGEIFNGEEWIKDKPMAQRYPHSTIQTYSDFWGMRNIAIARLLTKKQVEALTPFKTDEMEDGLLYLELRHTPSLSFPQPVISEQFGPSIMGYTTVIPLQEKHLKALMSHLYTCRFVVQNGQASPYRAGSQRGPSSTSPRFPGVPDGTYEFYYGKGVKVGWGGITTELPSDHPLYNQAPSHIQKLFNIGIEMSTQVEPSARNQIFYPNRYAYFRDGALYVMGGAIMEKEDPLLQSFHKREHQREESSTEQAPYVAFKDYGPPLASDGKIDKDFIRTFGFKIPEGQYLALGDNHAMSQDSRSFGPIPQANLQGAPSLIIWPPGDRWGIPNQKPYPVFTLPRLIIWSIAALIGLTWWLLYRRNKRQPIFHKVA